MEYMDSDLSSNTLEKRRECGECIGILPPTSNAFWFDMICILKCAFLVQLVTTGSVIIDGQIHGFPLSHMCN